MQCNATMSDEPPKTVTTTAAFPPVSPLGFSKWTARTNTKDATKFPSLPSTTAELKSEKKTPVTICDDDSSSRTEADTMAKVSFSPTNGIETLILAATDSLAHDDESSSNTTLSNPSEEQDIRSVSSSSSGGRKLRSWEDSFQALLRYKEKHGNCDVPVRYPQDSALANWVRYQLRHHDSIPSERRQQLDSIGFQVGARNDRLWEMKFQRLREWMEKHGTRAIIRDCELSQWVSTQRSLYKKNLLRADRQDKLDSIHFFWQANENQTQTKDINIGHSQSRRNAQWKAQFEKLKEFHGENGHFLVPNHYGKDSSLGIWVSNQRSIFNRGQLSEDRKVLLDSIGFVWRVDAKEARASLYKKQWEQQLEALIQYKLLYGSCDVPANFAKKGLGSWVAMQKECGRKGSLEPDRAEKLLSTGLIWGEERETCWTKNFVKLRGFLMTKEVDSELLLDDISNFDVKLGSWTKLQNVMKKHDKLPPNRVCLLENIGYKWNEAKMVVTQVLPLEPQLHQQPKSPSIPFVPDFAPSGPVVQATKTTKTLESVRQERNPAKRNSLLFATQHPWPSIGIAPASLKRQISLIRGTSRRGRDPPGDPPGKRVKLGIEAPIPMIVRSDPPGAPPCEVLSSFRI